MKISDVMERLAQLLAKHGDVECLSDCPHCLQSFPVGRVVPVAQLKTEKP